MRLNKECYIDILRTLQDHQGIILNENEEVIDVEMSFEEMCSKLPVKYEILDVWYATKVLKDRGYIRTNGDSRYPYLIKYFDLTSDGHRYIISCDESFGI